MFPRIAIHTGNTVVLTNKHADWFGTVVLQHNETTATMLKFGTKLSRAARKRHSLLSTFQSDCEAEHWAPFVTNLRDYDDDVHSGLILGQNVSDDGTVISYTEPPTVGVQPPIEHC
jgi:hypothetical protein